MVCYAVPALAALIHYGTRKKVTSLKNNVYQKWLTLLLAGGAIFGIIDHLWNGELFLIGNNLASDLLLGTIITIMISVVWIIVVTLDKIKMKKAVTTTN